MEDDDVKCLHGERNIYITCSRFHLYSCTPSVSKYLSLLTFFYKFGHSSYPKIIQVPCILFATYFTIVCILNSLPFNIFIIFFSKTNGQSCRKTSTVTYIWIGGVYDNASCVVCGHIHPRGRKLMSLTDLFYNMQALPVMLRLVAPLDLEPPVYRGWSPPDRVVLHVTPHVPPQPPNLYPHRHRTHPLLCAACRP
jgi:hypothetical protein